MRKHRKRVLYRGFIPAISLRVDGIVRPISSWDQLQHKFTLSANQLMEIKLATFNFKRDENRKYDQIVRRLNKPNESPIHFAFTTDYDDDAVPKCPGATLPHISIPARS